MSNSTEIASYHQMVKTGRAVQDNAASLPVVRVAVMADHATQQFVLVLKAALLERGFFPEIYEAEYSTAAFEAHDPDSGLYAFKPDFVFLSYSVQKYRDLFYASEAPEERAGLAQSHLSGMLGIIDAIRERKIGVIVSNFAIPIERIFGNYALHTPQSLYGSVLEFNRRLSEALVTRKGCQVNDMMFIASQAGLSNFFDERLWYTAKYPCATRFFPEMARSISGCIAVRKGRLTKCVILDLDNTLWGGVIGDDGKDGIKLGGDAHGEAFQGFQRYILSLKRRGYVLAVCSKNTEAIALDAFKNHPEMILKEEDIAVFVANWNDKASNIEFIARVLNLGLDSFVFVDDSAFERNQVRTALPMVAVPEMPEEVSEYVATLEASGLFEAEGYSDADAQRGQMYREEAQRTTEQIKYSNIDEYLESLDMQIDCREFQAPDLPRVAQLIQRSNQFNLRTQRLSEADCESYMLDKPGRFTVQARLKDKFGDYGLISVIACDVRGQELFVSELVMSCRVLKRGVETYLMNHLFDEARRRGLTGLRGEYIKSAKNGMVEKFFEQFGFQLVEDRGDRQTWALDASAYRNGKTAIKQVGQ